MELRVRLNPSEVVTSFAGNLREPVERLKALGVPIDSGVVGSITGAAQLDLSSLTRAAARLAEQLAGQPIDLPNPAALVEHIESLIALVEGIDPRGLDAALRGAMDQATAALKLSSNTRVDLILEQLTASIGASPQGKEILRVLTKLVQLAGADGAFLDDVKAVLPAALGLIRAIGGLLRVESALSEGDRLTTLLRSQLDRDNALGELVMIDASLGYAAEQLRAAATDPTLLPEAERSSLEALARIDLVQENTARRFAFAESTLLYADLPGTLAEVKAGLDEAQHVDLAAAGRTVGKMVDRFMPAFSVPLPPAPADSFDALLRLLEGQVVNIARKIERVDVTRIGAPITALVDKVTAPIRELERLSAELTHAADQATASVASLVNSLPTGDLTNALTAATAPLRSAMTQVTTAVQAIEAAMSTAAAGATGALVDAEEAMDTLMAALHALVGDASAFVQELGVDRAIGELQERMNALGHALEQAAVRPYFDTAGDAIDTTASVLEKVPVIMLPEDIKAEFDALVEPIRSLNVDAVAGEVESWFALEDGHLPFEPPLLSALEEVKAQLDGLIAAIEPHHPRLLGAMVDAELAPLRAEAQRLDLSSALTPIDQAIAQLKRRLDGVDPAAALAPVSKVVADAANQLDALNPATLIAPLQKRLAAVREGVIQTLGLEAASKALEDLEREALRLITLLDPARIEPELAAGMAVMQRELASLDRATLGSWGGTILSALLSGDGSRRRPASWAQVFAALTGEPATSRLMARAQRIRDAVDDASRTAASLDLGAVTLSVGRQLGEIQAALGAFPAGAPIRLSLDGQVRRRGSDGGFGRLEVNRTRFITDVAEAHGPAAALLQLELGRVDVAAAAIAAAAAPIARLRDQLMGMFRQLGIRRAGDGLGAVLGEVLEVATPARLAGILVPVFTALRGRAAALLGAVIGPLRAALDQLVSLLRGVDLDRLTQGVSGVIAAGKAQILALDPAALLAPALNAFGTLRSELQAFDPLAPLRAVITALRQVIDRLLGTPGTPGKLSAERLLAPASEGFEALLGTLRQLDVERLIEPLLVALRALAGDIRDGIDGLRDGLKRLQAAIPSTEGLSLAGVDVAIDVDLPF